MVNLPETIYLNDVIVPERKKRWYYRTRRLYWKKNFAKGAATQIVMYATDYDCDLRKHIPDGTTVKTYEGTVTWKEIG
jgi:phosphoribosyl-AMP cyclohydrolase